VTWQTRCSFRNPRDDVIKEVRMTSPQRPDSPAVSIVIPAFKAATDIPDALASVFRQTFTDYEVILVNDGSPDTPALEAAIQPHQSRIGYIVQPNLGAAAARNTGIRAARGRYLAFLDADDIWLPEFLERQVGYLTSHSSSALVYADALITGATPLARRRFTQTAPSNGPATLNNLLGQRCNIMLSTVVARRDAVIEAGGFDETVRRGHDADLWFRMARLGAALHYQPLVLAERRVRADGLSGDRLSELTRAIAVIDRFGRLHPLSAEERTTLRTRLLHLRTQLEVEEAKQRLVEGNFAAARTRLARHRPASLKIWAARLGLVIAPRLFRRVYLKLRGACHAVGVTKGPGLGRDDELRSVGRLP
jgi:glycosyltransferase involved in cell wall biosynthesis